MPSPSLQVKKNKSSHALILVECMFAMPLLQGEAASRVVKPGCLPAMYAARKKQPAR
jgi:hypothetical protein